MATERKGPQASDAVTASIIRTVGSVARETVQRHAKRITTTALTPYTSVTVVIHPDGVAVVEIMRGTGIARLTLNAEQFSSFDPGPHPAKATLTLSGGATVEGL